MNQTLQACLLLLCFGVFTAPSMAEEANTKSYYLIGNSLTWDTLPRSLDGDVAWHVDCGVRLSHIHAHPEEPCVETSTLWPTALKEKQYDVISVQPHYRSTLAEDVETISAWMEMQPRAVFVIHSGWARHDKRAAEFANFDTTGELNHGPAYYRALVAQLQERYPNREIRQTRAINLLEQIAQDVAAAATPFQAVSELHRDEIHMQHESGKYLMHNAMRHALGQPFSSQGFDKMEPKVKDYLDGVLALLSVKQSDQELLEQILATSDDVDRSQLIDKIASDDLKAKLTALLPEIEKAVVQRREAMKLESDLKEIGGKLYYQPQGPQWLYLAAQDSATELFQVPVAIDLYNGNNPLKGKGGKNDRVTEAWLKRIAEVSTIKKLNLANCEIKDEWLKSVGTMSGLEELGLTLTPITDAGLAHLGSLTELRVLSLASAQSTGAGFAHLTALKKLENVNFHYTPLNDEGLLAISKVGVSDRLWFAHTHFTDEGAACLANLTELKRCGIGSKEKASSGKAVAALVKLPLEDLSLLDNQADNEGLANAAKIESLLRLDASYAPTVDDEALKAIAQMPRLKEFKLGSAKVTDEGIQVLATSPSLKKLTFSGLKNVTPEGLELLQKAKPELTIEAK